MLMIARCEIQGPQASFYKLVIFDSQYYKPNLVKEKLTTENSKVVGMYYATDVLGGEVEIWVPDQEILNAIDVVGKSNDVYPTEDFKE